MNELSRRSFLRNGLVAAGVGFGPRFFLRPAAAESASVRSLVVLFQRGAVDGLNMVVPYDEQRYYDLRPTIAIPQPGQQNGALDLDGRFGLHPAMSPLMPAFDAGELAFVHACGSHDPTRSHFDGQDFMEKGTPGSKNGKDGWLNRHLQSAGPSESIYRGVALSTRMPLILAGEADALAVGNLSQLSLGTGEVGQLIRDTIEGMYGDRDDLPGAVVRDSLEAVAIAGNLDPAQYVPRNGAVYPDTPAGNQLVQIAQVIRADVGMEVAFTDLNGWDTHSQEVGALGVLLAELAEATAAFRTDLGEDLADVCLVTLSEFGRTAAENGSGGTDHGHGTAMFALGGTVDGGRIYGDWPGLDAADLYQGRDLPVTTDYRTFLSEVIAGHLGNANISEIFPDFDFGAEPTLGIIRA